MKTKIFSRSFNGLIIIAQCVASLGCESEETDSNLLLSQERTRQSVTSITLTKDEINILAQKYLSEKMSTWERKATLEKIRSLSPDQSSTFFQNLKEIQITANNAKIDSEAQTMIEIGEAIDKYAASQGLNRLNLRREQIHEAIGLHYGFDEFKIAALNEPTALNTIRQNADHDSAVAIAKSALCIFPYVSCSTTSYTATAYGASCGFNCINGSSYDRVSNETCEIGACDHRIFYPSATRKNVVDGETSAADCVINYYGGIINRWENNYTQLGYGIAGPASCGIYLSVSEYLRDNTQVF